MSSSADMEQTDVSLAVYRTSFEFCCVCLKTRSESLLQQTNANDFLAAIQVQQVSPWLCVWCLASVRSFYRLKNKAQRSQQWLHNVGLETMISSENLELASELKQIKSEPYTVKILQHDECTISERSSESCVKIKQEHREGRPVDCQIVRRSCRKKRENWFQIGPAEAGDSQFYDKSSQFNQVIYIKSDSLNNSDDFDSRMSPEQIPPKLKRNRGRPRKISVKTKSITEKTRAAASPVKKENKYSVKRSTSNRRYAVGFTMTEAERQRDYEDRLARPQYVEAVFKCAKCGLGWHHREAYLKHIKSHSPSSGPLHCKICDSYYPTQNAIDSHTWNHYRRFRCVLCGYVGSSGAVSTHYFAVHSTDEFACEQCGRSFKRPKHLERHIERMHSDRKPHRCTLCFKVLWTEAALKYHMWSHNAKKKVWFSCDICHKKFPLKGNLKNHLKVHAPKKEPKDEEETQAVPVVCSICFKEFGSYDKLDRHMRRCHTVKKYQCDHCKKCFFSKSELKRHIYDVHLKIMAYACPNCAKMCPSKYSLRRHILRIHETVRVKDKLCDLCGKGFWTRQLLEKHRYTHTGERPYSCHYCGASFAQRSTMTTHIKLKHLKMKRTASGAFLKNESNVIL